MPTLSRFGVVNSKNHERFNLEYYKDDTIKSHVAESNKNFI